MNNKSQGLKFTNKYSSQISTILALIILCIVLSFLSENFLTIGNLLTVTNQVVYIALMAIGMTILFMLGAIDLSVGAILALSACVMGLLTNKYGMAPAPAILIAMAVSLLCGLINGLLVTQIAAALCCNAWYKLHFRGMAAIITGAKNSLIMPEGLRWIAAGKVANVFPRGIFYVARLIHCSMVLAEKTPFGIKIKCIGGNEKSCKTVRRRN